MKRITSTLVASVLFISCIHSQGFDRKTEKDTPYKDARDGQTYETVRYTTTYPDQTSHAITWMAKNFNYRTEDSFCYDEDEANCETYGRLYTWEAAMNACPDGWRLPSDEDWYRLSFHFGGNCSSGQALKSASELWVNEDQRGTNISLLNVLPAGQGGGNGGYFLQGRSAIFWSTTDRDAETTWDWNFLRESELLRWYGGKKAKHCMRCIRD